jgi:puromycin-sensitive aminopeptidase
LVVPEDRIALSNMNCTSGNELIAENADGSKKKKVINNYLKKVNFAKTPIMSTYILAFVVGEFDFCEGKTKDGLPIRKFFI